MSPFMAPVRTPRLCLWKCKRQEPFAGVRTNREHPGAYKQEQERVPGEELGAPSGPCGPLSLCTLSTKPSMPNTSGWDVPGMNQQHEEPLDQLRRKCYFILDNA